MTKNHELATAIESNDVETVKRILGSDPSVVNSPDWTPPPLHCAVLWNRPEVATVLLDNGANIEMKDPDRSTTPVRYAIVYAKPDMIKLLVAEGANVGAIVDGGQTALELAKSAAEGSLEEYEELPSRETYAEMVQVLESLGIEE